MMPRIDLHTHSSASDGILNPEALVSRAVDAGVEVLALTDHDTVTGLAEAGAAARAQGLTLIPAVELSCQWRGVGIHVVGLHINPQDTGLLEALAGQETARGERALEIARRLERRGIDRPLAGARTIAGRDSVARPHFAQYLVQAGYVGSIKAAFKQYLGAGKAGDVKHYWPELPTVVSWIRDSGGVAVLAHPHRYKMTNRKRRRLLGDFVDAGGGAMEVICGQQSREITAYLAELAGDFGLLASAGSDFHSPDYPWQRLGAFGTLPAHCQPVPLT